MRKICKNFQRGCCGTPFSIKLCKRERCKCVIMLSFFTYFLFKWATQKNQEVPTLFKINKTLQNITNTAAESIPQTQLLHHGQASLGTSLPEIIRSEFVEPCRFPWANDSDTVCSKVKVCFAKPGTFKSRALLSFPGSGNTWARYMIESATGYFTGSVYNDTVLYNSGYLGELRSITDGTTILQKYHNFYKQPEFVKLFEYRAVIIIRNPFDALITFRHYRVTKSNHTAHAKKKFFTGKGWVDFVKTQATNWKLLILEWVENSSDYLIVLYEDLRENPARELRRILEHVHLDSTNGDRIACLLRPTNLQGSFQRNNSLAGNNTKLKAFSKYADSHILNNIKIDYSNLPARKKFIISFIENCIQEVNDFFRDKRVMISLPYTLQTSSKIEMYL